MNFFDIQSDAFIKMINEVNNQGIDRDDPSDQQELAWKILIFDDFTFNIISNFKIGDLRELNVTLHIHINDAKEELPGVKAIYFISPTENSIKQFLLDLEKSYFDNVYLNFSGMIEKPIFENLTSRIIELRKTTQIKSIKLHYLDYYPLTDKFLTLGMQNTFGSDSPEFYDALTRKILNLVYILNDCPVVFYDKQSKRLEKIFESLNKEFSNAERYFKHNPALIKNKKKVALILWESFQDLSPFFVHEFKYFPLVAETFKLFKDVRNFNNIKINEATLRIDLRNDGFWSKNKFEDFPVVLENIYQEVGNWKQKYDRLNARNQSEADIYEMSENFNEALESLPQMTEENKINENHTKIASYLMKEVERKSLEKLCVISTEIFQTKRITKDNWIEICNIFENKEIAPWEKIRFLCLINYNTTIDAKEYEKVESIAKANSSFTEAEASFLNTLKQEKYSQDNKNVGILNKFKTVSENILRNVMAESVKCRISNIVLDVFRKREVEGLKVKALAQSSDQLNLDNITTVIICAVDGGCLKEMYEVDELKGFVKRDVIYVASEMQFADDIIAKLINKPIL